jgi:thioredoxin 1
MVEQHLANNSVDYEKINIEDRPEIAMQYGVMSVPVTILLDDDGQELNRVVGFNPDEIDKLIEQL